MPLPGCSAIRYTHLRWTNAKMRSPHLLTELRFPAMKLSILSLPWLSILCIGMAYGLLGWELALFSAMWVIDIWLLTILVIFGLIWRSQAVGRLMRLGPRSLVSIFLLSMTVTLAAAYAEPFGLALVLLLTIAWGRLELQTRGLSQRVTLTVLSLVAGGSLTGGWFLARNVEAVTVLQHLQRWLPVNLGLS